MMGEMKHAHPAIPWRQIVGMRNRLIHVYFDINRHIVWRTIKDDLPPLIEGIRRILQA